MASPSHQDVANGIRSPMLTDGCGQLLCLDIMGVEGYHGPMATQHQPQTDFHGRRLIVKVAKDGNTAALDGLANVAVAVAVANAECPRSTQEQQP